MKEELRKILREHAEWNRELAESGELMNPRTAISKGIRHGKGT